VGNPYLAAKVVEIGCGESSKDTVRMTVAAGEGLATNCGSRLASDERPPQLASDIAMNARVTALQSIVQFGMNILLRVGTLVA